MPRTPTRNPRLQDRDDEILRHLMRYRLTTPGVLHKLFFDDSERNAVTKATSRLTSHRFLESHPLFTSQTYFNLGPNGAKAMGLSVRKTGPLGPQALFTEFGTLAFCCMGENLHKRLRVSELMRENPALVVKGLDSSHYYVDTDEKVSRLGLIRVDGGGDVAHVVRKCRQDIEAREQVPAFRQLISEGRFLMAIVTLSDLKRVSLEQELRKVTSPVTFRVAVVPDLRNFLARHA